MNSQTNPTGMNLPVILVEVVSPSGMFFLILVLPWTVLVFEISKSTVYVERLGLFGMRARPD